MSRAFVTRVKKVRTHGESRLMKLFGAAGIDAGLFQGIERHSVSDLGFGFPLDALAPLVDPVPFDSSIGFPASIRLEVTTRSVTPRPAPSPGEQPRPLLLPESCALSESSAADRELLEGIFILFEDSGLRVRETKQLSSGVTRITVDELIAQARAREPEPVRVGG
jgi:hypothetical protein